MTEVWYDPRSNSLFLITRVNGFVAFLETDDGLIYTLTSGWKPWQKFIKKIGTTTLNFRDTEPVIGRVVTSKSLLANQGMAAAWPCSGSFYKPHIILD